MSYLIGVDGGQSGTRCVVGRPDATVVAIGAGSAVDHVLAPGGRAGLERALTSASQAAVRGLPHEPIEVAYLAISGVVPPGPEADVVAQLAAGLWPSAAVHISHDLRAAWAGAFGLRPGIVVVAGSGSAAFGVAADGREARAGGWGYLFGDEGAGWWMAREAIAAALRARDGTGPQTPLTERLQAHFGTTSIDAIVKGVYAGRFNRSDVGEASRVVLETASTGDPVSRSVVERGALALATLVDAVRRTLHWQKDVPVAPAGRMWNSVLLFEAFVTALKQIDQRMVVHAPAFPPNVGAFLLALQAAGAPVSLETVRASWEALGGARS